ncbi:hypothetical protein Zmor_013409 [Zophobas morio]|uniref:SMP-30/Gluconolactonase/LRE-like region domain-containing protein n=1 Tax=Zophobas morio TaxID=2755281 RepID=A0AA38IDZ2_9CUCU|nr:hypothetical protein Zmor_013409 [Zophobas morio]
MVTVERIVEGCMLGEGPHWDVATQSLYFIDLIDKNILKYTPSTKKLSKVPVEKAPSFIIPVEGETNQFIISQQNELVIISWDDESNNIKILQKICGVETPAETPKLFNDAKCDCSGRLWAGAHSIASDFAKTEPLGALYSV